MQCERMKNRTYRQRQRATERERKTRQNERSGDGEGEDLERGETGENARAHTIMRENHNTISQSRGKDPWRRDE